MLRFGTYSTVSYHVEEVEIDTTYINGVEPLYSEWRATFGVATKALPVHWRREMIISCFQRLCLGTVRVSAFLRWPVFALIPRIESIDGGAPCCLSRPVLVGGGIRRCSLFALHDSMRRWIVNAICPLGDILENVMKNSCFRFWRHQVWKRSGGRGPCGGLSG